jgi:hypothetical protein
MNSVLALFLTFLLPFTATALPSSTMPLAGRQTTVLPICYQCGASSPPAGKLHLTYTVNGSPTTIDIPTFAEIFVSLPEMNIDIQASVLSLDTDPVVLDMTTLRTVYTAATGNTTLFSDGTHLTVLQNAHTNVLWDGGNDA